MDRSTWLVTFHATLIDLASGHEEKAKFAADYGREIGSQYLEDAGVWKDPREAARFEFGCWVWWGRHAAPA